MTTTTAAAPLIQNKSAVPKEFNRIADKYDLATSLSQGYAADLEASVAWLALNGNERVLELCCGTGKSTSALLAQLPYGTVTALDNSEGMLAVAEKKFAAEIQEGKVSLVLSDAMHPPFENESFDAVFVAYGLRNMPDYEAFLAEIYRVLKPGGKVCIHDYSIKETFWAKAYWAILGYGFIVPFCTLLTGSSTIFTYLVKSVLSFARPEEVKTMMQKSGFSEVKGHPHKGWRGPILHAFVAKK
jgi:ubiquinone/menaquinone biosynthesis methyltransferase